MPVFGQNWKNYATGKKNNCRIPSQTDSAGKPREEGMEKMFCLGLALGMVGGALIVANSYKARSLVKKSQAELLEKVDEMMDERLKDMPGKDTSDKKSK